MTLRRDPEGDHQARRAIILGRFGTAAHVAKSDAERYHHSVYIVLLRDDILKFRWVVRKNPARDPMKPAVYVGMTGLPVDHRFQNHLNGYKSAKVVQKYGVRLLPELFEHLNPMPFDAAAQMEKELAEDLRAEGYAVLGGT